MTDILQQICAKTRAHIEQQKKTKTLGALEAEARHAFPPRGFTKAIEKKIAAGNIALITEIKKASPSAGTIRPNYNPAEIAREYESAGAACLSVLTDIAYFQGSNEDLIATRTACALPVLRKDFMLDTWQVAEARAIGADCILLIMAALDDKQATDLHAAATHYNMDILIESHDQAELDRALKLPSGMIGINNRNLKTLKTDLATTETLARHVPPNRILVSESGIATAADIARLQKANAHTFLIGESLLKQDNITTAIEKLTTNK
jgi:indole-3-glycerol phosphate synthase